MYGPNTTELRSHLTTLLRQHRVQHRLGDSPDERAAAGDLVRSYRRAILGWAETTLAAVTTGLPHHTTTYDAVAITRLRMRLRDAIALCPDQLPDAAALCTPRPEATLDAWRQAARASALGEHDFPTPDAAETLTRGQRLTVTGDVATVLQALVILDHRYARVPGWTALHHPGRLAQAADAVTASVHAHADTRVDQYGWQPRLRPIDSPALTGFAGVLQAQHNLLVHLDQLPDAHTLRLVLDAQRQLAHHASLIAAPVSPDLATHWQNRTQTFQALVAATRDLRSLTGSTRAAPDADSALHRTQRLTPGQAPTPEQLRHLDALFTAIDERLVQVLDLGTRHRVYLQRIGHHSEEEPVFSGGIVQQPAAHYTPLDAPAAPQLCQLLNGCLRRSEPQSATAPADSRSALRTALTHRAARERPTASL